MSWFSRGAALPAFPATGYRWAVVDVETSGLSRAGDRVLSLAALALDEDGRPARSLVTLLDPGCDPGPVHIHGLTREELRGSPTFGDVLPVLQELLERRVLVAHNASFDHDFLAAEAQRCGTVLSSRSRLCTLALSRRLGLPVANHTLASLAQHWGVPQRAAHDAHDDALVLAQVFHRSLVLAAELGLPLPVLSARPVSATARPAAVTRIPCPWVDPGPWQPGRPLVQGTIVVVTGPVSSGREALVRRMQAAGLDVANTVSRRTGLLVTNDRDAVTVKARRARRDGVPFVDEATVLRLLGDVRRGRPRDRAVLEVSREPERPVPPRRPAAAVGGWAGQRVLVVGGSHADGRTARAQLAAVGGAAAVNLTASVTHVLLLSGGERDPRVARARDRGVPAVRLSDLQHDPTVVRARGTNAPPVLVRGAVVDLPHEVRRLTVDASWRALAGTTDEIDVVALLLDPDDRVSSDDDLVYYGSPQSEDGAVTVAEDGTSEQSVTVDLDRLRSGCTTVAVAAVVTGSRRFGDVGAVEIAVRSSVGTELTATLDAGTTEQTMVLLELYLRRDTWRVRVVGQGYDDGLAELATRHGVEVDD